MDPQIDALIENFEQAVDYEEQVKLVKQAQLEAVKKFSSCYLVDPHGQSYPSGLGSELRAHSG